LIFDFSRSPSNWFFNSFYSANYLVNRFPTLFFCSY